MKHILAFRLFLAACLVLLWSALSVGPVHAQATQCGGVNFTPTPGVVCALEPIGPSYGATSVALVPAASATDIACITGAANKVIRVQIISISGTAGTAVTVPVLITKHVSANSGGTLATSTALPVPYTLDPNNSAGVATTQAWTANPTINDANPGILDSGVVSLVTTSSGVGFPTKFDYQERNFIQAMILRSAAQQVCVNLNSTSITSGLLYITFRWTELSS